ncbi:MAG: hypothetical protein QXM53_05380 [Thermofilaceae archaeon]
MIAIVLLFLFGLVYGQNPVYENYRNSTHPTVDLYADLYNSDFTFLRNLSKFWMGGNRDMAEGWGKYAERAWMFENTMALLGFLEGIKKSSNIDPDKYRNILNNALRKFADGRLRNWNDASNGVANQQRLKEYYQAVFLGVLSGIGPGFIVVPDAPVAARYGEVSVPVLGYRATMQAIRSALLMEYAYRAAYARAELASLYWYAKQQCDGVNDKISSDDKWKANINSIETLGDMTPATGPGYCCPTNLSYLANIRSILSIGFRTLIDQNTESLKLQCISLLTQLHNAKINLEIMELVLYNLSVNYSQLAITEKTMVR